MWDLLLAAAFVAVVLFLVFFGDDLPNGIAELAATLTGVVAGIRLEHWVAFLSEQEEARKARGLLKGELEANLTVAEKIASEENDYPAIVASVLSLKIGIWSSLSRGARLHAIVGVDLLRALDKAYAALEDLRQIAALFFQGSKWVVSTRGPGLNQTFDALRKERARAVVCDVKKALTLLEREGTESPD